MKYLIVIDMQHDFVDGVLGSKEAVAILPTVKEKIEQFNGKVIFTRDTHDAVYLSTREGKYLPVDHGFKGSDGWQIHEGLAVKDAVIFDKPTFGSTKLMEYMVQCADVESITLIGVCTDICVISNAMLLKAALPQIDIIVDAACCAGVTPQSHLNALAAMQVCQIIIENN